MTCKKCKQKPVIQLTNSKITLCKKCFIRYFEKKVRKTIRKYNLFDKKDKLGIGVSGGVDSMATLHILSKLARERRAPEVIAIHIDNGVKGYSRVDIIKKYCKENKIKLKLCSFKEEYNLTMDSAVKKIDIHPCSFCGVLRRRSLNKIAKKLKLDKLATGHNLDDEAQTIIMNSFRNNMGSQVRLGPITGIKEDKRFIRRIKPLYFMTEKETALYASLNGLGTKGEPCPYKKGSFRYSVQNMLNKFEEEYSGTLNSIVNSFLDILPILKKHYKLKSKIKKCKICKEPCAREVCQACLYLKEFNQS